MRGVLVLLLAMTISAYADPKQEAKKHVETADVAYKLGHFEQALAEYSAAYQVFPVPALLFNIGQCHKYLGHYEQALFFYRGYLRDSPSDITNRDVVEGLITETQALLDKQHADEAKLRADLEATAKAVEEEHVRDEHRREEEDAQRRTAEEQRVAAARQAPPEPAPPIYKRWWFWPAVGGVAVAAGGTALLVTSHTTLIEPTGTLGGLDRR